MTVWDDIYKKFKKDGTSWATVKSGLMPEFVQFIEENTFDKKSALDIGFGRGKYLKYLQEKGFKIAGVDSSETAVSMARKLLGDGIQLDCLDMYKMEIPKNEYDLILSIHTLHHGTKKEIMQLIEKIWESLCMGGKAFITLPNDACVKEWKTFLGSNFNERKEIAPGTFLPVSGPEKGLPHSFFNEEEARKIFSRFGVNDLRLTMGTEKVWIVIVSK